MAGDIESSSIFGVRIADSFGTVVSPQSHVVIGVAVALMCLMLFAMQWLLIHRNTPKDAMDSPQFRTQKLTAFVFPAIYVVSGGTLPFGVLLYYFVANASAFHQQDGRRYHHILDPRTGMPSRGPHGVALVARDVAAVNGLGAAIMVGGAAAGRHWLGKRREVDALIVGDGAAMNAPWLSPGMARRLRTV